MRYHGKVVVVTGGSRGIGAATVRRFVDEGATVHFTYRSGKEEAEKLLKEYNHGEERVFAYKVDLRDKEQIEDFVQQVVSMSQRVDVLIHNAGITRDTLLLRMREEDWDDVLHTNLTAVYRATKLFLPVMLRQRSGCILLVSSIVGLIGNAGQTNYAASKAALIGFGRSLAKEVGSRNIRVNIIAPGYVRTDMTEKLTEQQKSKLIENIPLGKIGNPEDIAAALAFLASDDAAYITGEVLVIDGGLSL